MNLAYYFENRTPDLEHHPLFLPTLPDFVVTNDLTQTATDAVQEVCGIRWQIEEFHRELKQLTGVEACVFAARQQFNERFRG